MAAVAPVAAATEVKAEPVEVSTPFVIDGKQVMLTPTQVRTHIQKAGAADKRMQEATERQRKLDAMEALADSDPEEFLRQRGRDPAKIIAKLLADKAKLELMSPEQQAAVKLQQERDEARAEADKLKAERQQEAQDLLDQRNQTALETQLISSAEKYGLDKTPETLEGLCQVAMDLLEYGTSPTPDEVAQEFLRREEEHLTQRDKKVVGRLKGDKLKAYIKSNAAQLLALPDAELLEVLGAAGLRKIQAATLSRIPSSAKPNVVAPAPVPMASKPRAANGKYITEADIDRKYRR